MRTFTLIALFTPTISYTNDTGFKHLKPLPSTAQISTESHGSWMFVTNEAKISATTSYPNDSDSGSVAGDGDVSSDGNNNSASASAQKPQTPPPSYEDAAAALVAFADRPKPKRCCGCRFWR